MWKVINARRTTTHEEYQCKRSDTTYGATQEEQHQKNNVKGTTQGATLWEATQKECEKKHFKN